jgi:hypothetical protein
MKNSWCHIDIRLGELEFEPSRARDIIFSNKNFHTGCGAQIASYSLVEKSFPGDKAAGASCSQLTPT